MGKRKFPDKARVRVAKPDNAVKCCKDDEGTVTGYDSGKARPYELLFSDGEWGNFWGRELEKVE